jgi:hypothetical protein
MRTKLVRLTTDRANHHLLCLIPRSNSRPNKTLLTWTRPNYPNFGRNMSTTPAAPEATSQSVTARRKMRKGTHSCSECELLSEVGHSIRAMFAEVNYDTPDELGGCTQQVIFGCVLEENYHVVQWSSNPRFR